MRVLFTTPILEHPPAGGPQLRVENSIKALSTPCELHVVSRATRRSVGEAGEALYRSLSRGFYYAPAFAGNRYLRRIRRTLLRANRDETRSSAQFIVDLVDQLGIDVVWFGHGQISFPLIREVKAARPDLKTVCDTDSVWSRYVLRELPFAADPIRRAQIERAGREKEAEERAWVNLCEVTTAVSEVDADYYRAIAREPARIQVFSNAIDVRQYETVPPAPPDLVHPCMYLAGSFVPAGSPMEVAATWVLEEVLPRVRQELPDIRFYIVGRGSQTISAAVDGPDVVVKGKLPSVLPYLCHADVALVPLKFESGTRFKILEAGACGVPLVSTVLGAEGIPVIDNEHILLADDPLPFAQAIVKLIKDRPFAEQLAQNCRQLVRERYTIESLSREAAHILEYLGGQRMHQENGLG
jgi:glycosyltransferase involved in cell wall biosynthesis